MVTRAPEPSRAAVLPLAEVMRLRRALGDINATLELLRVTAQPSAQREIDQRIHANNAWLRRLPGGDPYGGRR